MKKISNLIACILILLSLIIIYLTIYIKTDFHSVNIEQLIYSLYNAEGTSNSVIITGALYIVPRVIITLAIIILGLYFLKKYAKTKQYLIINIKNKKTFKISLFVRTNLCKIIISLLIFIITILFFCISFEVFDYINPYNRSTYIEDNYVYPENVKITAPEKKQNLIYIYVESMESSFFSNENGGNFVKSVIPNLEKIALNNISFSSTDKLGGAKTMSGTTYTTAGIVASTMGIPLKFPFGEYSGQGEYLPGGYGLGDILKDNGYTNYFFIDSDAKFGGRKDYFENHGSYKIYDYYYAMKKKWIDEDYRAWWGYEDNKLYEFAKIQLKEIAEKGEPFNFTMLTTGTHFPDGYVEKTCKNKYDYQYLNAYNCTDEMLEEFINWLVNQDFYNNTTIVITGDRLTHQENIAEMFDNQQNERTVYNAYINSKINTDNTKNRQFNTFDFYPTTLAALGFEIQGDRLGLGTNLFSNKKTLLEESNYTDVENELSKKSIFYNNKILEDN